MNSRMKAVKTALRERYWAWRLNRLAQQKLAVSGKERHRLNSELIVSLTSFPLRFAGLHHTLRSLLDQTVAPDRVILWIAVQDMPLLPQAVRELEPFGLSILPVEDVLSYKKLVFALRDFPEAVIVTADDDVFYPRTWLSTLLSGYDEDRPSIVCRRAHRIKFNDGAFQPYLSWDLDVQDERALTPSKDLAPIGVGGTLYPPGSLHPDVTRQDLFLKLCPHADDLWFWWMGRRLDTKTRRVGGPFVLRPIPDTQNASLKQQNMSGRNDEQLNALVDAFGVNDLRLD